MHAQAHVKGGYWCRARIADRVDEFECILCLKMLYQPVTAPCGHTFCRDCFLRAGDHSNKCPMCRTVRPQTNSSQGSHLLSSLIPCPSHPKKDRYRFHILETRLAVSRATALYCITSLFRPIGQTLYTASFAMLGSQDQDPAPSMLSHDLLGSESKPLLSLAGAACG